MEAIAHAKQLLTCPGDTILETIESVGMSQAELAQRIGYPKNKLNQLIRGQVILTPAMAGKLSSVLGIPPGFWLELERIYQEEKLSIDQREALNDQID